MKRFILVFFSLFISIIFMWFISGYLRYGNNMFNMHLDFYATLQQFVSNSSNGFDINEYLSYFDFIQSESSALDWIVGIFRLNFVGLVIVWDTLSIATDFFIGIVRFVFFPVFV